MIDIDHFKKVNDEFGDGAGDQILASLARRCRDSIRHVEIQAVMGAKNS